MAAYQTIAIAAAMAGAANLTALAVVFAAAPRGARRPAYRLGAAMALLGAAAAGAIAIQNFAPFATPAFLDGLEIGLTLAAGPLFYLLVATLAGVATRWAMVAAPAAMVGAMLLAAPVVDIRAAVLVQMAYSVAAGVAVARTRLARRQRAAPPVVAGLLAAALVLHAAQAARMAFAGVEALSGVVPAALFVMAFGAVVAMVWRGAHGRRRRKPIAGAMTGHDMDVAQLRAALIRSRDYLDPDFRLAAFAAAVGAPPAYVSAVINRETGAGFARFVNDARVAHARRLLSSPQEARTSVEAVALMAGFRSRSAFYRAYRDAFGETPAATRAKTLS